MREELHTGYTALVEELHLTFGRLGLALALARDAFAWIDRQGRIVWCNAALDTLTGRDHLEVLGAPLWDVLPLQRAGVPISPDAHPARRALAQADDIDEQYDVVIGDRRMVVEVFGRRGMIAGEPAALLVVYDITETARAQQELADLNAKLEAANDELEAFTYSVSHDLRTPLRAIDGFSQALSEDYASVLDSVGNDYLRRLRLAAQKMGRLIDDLLRLSRITRTELSWAEIDLSAMCRSIVAELAASAPSRGVEVVIPNGLSIRGDERLLRQAIENLLGNAWKFTARARRPRIEVGTITPDRGTEPVFFIRDNGAGFDMAHAEKLFGAFQRLHTADEFPGTGIGLAIARRIIHRHGGRVWAEAAVGKGATFYFTLPSDRTGAS